ncbi:hypothetical protein IQ249_18700 [Lusitaniella coriacea LEGE 07157]|uniref:Uncharacterized protein n=1 Tax=Lusitaniella coriacea LEGE 07157 TaxID=945747 RepID=A0A8J7DZZ0_9CYAN|nr:hypothetical protein [Lusitaniella coriacea]MBE9117931.1 hypothetical protein [Lusitaniella coriacea LEGE 07157]
MSKLVFFDAIASREYEGQEDAKVEYLSHPPEIGDRVSMGGLRLWNVVDIDSYYHPDNPEQVLYLAHCTAAPLTNPSSQRANWFRIKAYQNREPTLQLFLGEGMLLHVHRDLVGGKPEVGYLLPQYDPKEHIVKSRPWGITSVTSYLPSPDIERVCYLKIHIGQCVYVSEASGTNATNQLITA